MTILSKAMAGSGMPPPARTLDPDEVSRRDSLLNFITIQATIQTKEPTKPTIWQICFFWFWCNLRNISAVFLWVWPSATSLTSWGDKWCSIGIFPLWTQFTYNFRSVYCWLMQWYFTQMDCLFEILAFLHRKWEDSSWYLSWKSWV